MSNTIVIKRTGQAPLRVRAKLIASASIDGAEALVYHTVADRYIVAVGYDSGTYDAAVFPTVKQCVEFLKGRVPKALVEQLVVVLGQSDA